MNKLEFEKVKWLAWPHKRVVAEDSSEPGSSQQNTEESSAPLPTAALSAQVSMSNLSAAVILVKLSTSFKTQFVIKYLQFD